MLYTIYIIGSILILVIFLLIFYIYQLISTNFSKKNKNKKNQKQGLFLLIFFIIGMSVLGWYSYIHFDSYTLPVASQHGSLTDRLFWITTAVTGSVFIITQILLFYFSYKYQYQKNRKVPFYTHHTVVEVVWTIIPAIVLTLLTLAGMRLWSGITQQHPTHAEIIEIVGQQFTWKARYPGKSKKLGKYDFRYIDAVNELGIDLTDTASFDNFVSNILYLPKGKPVLLKIRSKDVIHSVYIPHFRVKMDAVPGMSTQFWFVPNKTTYTIREELGNPTFNYELACAEICGTGHFAMKMIVKVVEPEYYDQWVAKQPSWLSKNPSYCSKVPKHLKKNAMKKANIPQDILDN